MAYIGKYTDRNPGIVSAGIQSEQSHGVKELLVYTSLDDKVTALKHEHGIFNEQKPLSAPEIYPLSPDSGARYEGIYTNMKDIITPPRRSDFEQMREELMETTYAQSYWNAPLGKTRYSVQNLPKGFDPLTTTLGRPLIVEIPLGELVNPPKLPGQVLFEDSIGHDLYVKSHQDYDPGEQVNRNYLPEYFDPTQKFGVPTPSDRRGIWVPKCIHWYNNEPFTIASNRQANAIVHGPQIGKCLLREEILGDVVPKNHTFGIPTPQANISVPELLHNSDACEEKRKEAEFISHINTVRLGLKKNHEFDWKAFLARFRFYDKSQSKMLPLSKVYEICQMFRVNFDKPLLEMLLKRLRMLNDNQCVDYVKFVEMLDRKFPFPDLPNKIEDIPASELHYDTTYETSYKPLPHTIEDFPAAGTPSVRNDLKYPKAVINALKESFGDETNMNTLVSPSYFTSHGLSHRDFFMPRSMAELASIFTKEGDEWPKGLFERIYCEGFKLDRTGGVCVETFRNLLARLCSRRLSATKC